jgi:lysozyme family protein
MDRDVAIRVRAAIEATLREQGSYPTFSEGLVEAETRFRNAIQELLTDDDPRAAEFRALFPASTPRARPAGLSSRERLDGASVTKNARMHLAGMSGWLQGLIDASDTGRTN